MKKYLISALLLVVLLFTTPAFVKTTSAQDISFSQLVQLLISIGVIPQDKIPAVNAFLASYGGGSVATSTRPLVTVTSPNVGETYKIGDNVKIKWTYSPLPPKDFSIYLVSSTNPSVSWVLRSCGSGSTYYQGDASSPNNYNIFSFNWQVGQNMAENLSAGQYKIQIGDCMPEVTSGSSNYFTISPKIPTQPGSISATVIGTPTLKLSYDSANKESQLTAAFNVSITAGNKDLNVVQYSNAIFTNQTDTRNNFSGTITFSPSQALSSSKDQWGRTYYTIPAGTTASFNAISQVNPKIMFAGSYTAQPYVATIDPTDTSGAYYNPISISGNTTNAVTIIGEVSPYITTASFVKAITSGFDGVRVTGSRFNVSQSANITCNNAGMIHSKPNINSSSGVDYLFLDTPKSSDNCWIQITDQNTGASNVVYFQISGPISSSVPSITIDAKALMGINDSVVTIYGQNLYNTTAHIINPNDGNIEVAKAQLGSDANWLNSDKTSVSFKVYLVQSNYAVYLTDSSGNVSNKVEILLHAYSQNTGNSFSMGWQAGGTNASYGDTYANPRIFSLTSTEEYVPATDQASVDKWCQSIVGKSYFSGTASSYTAGSGKRTQWNGNTWIINAYSTTDYPGSITCSNSQSSSQQQNQITLSASVINNTDNKAGRVGVFGPGNGSTGNPNDWTWSINLSTPVDGKVLKDITIKTNDGSNIWSTSNSANYPLVLFINGKQLNSSYSFTQALVNGSRVITAYGQQEETAWNGGNIFITFTDGSSVFAPIQAYNVTPPVATPTITSISPTSGPAGSTITIYGNNFNSMDTIVLYLSSNHNNTIMPPPNSVSKDGTSMNFVIPQNSLVSKYDLAIFTPATIGQISNSISSNEVPFTITSATPTQASVPPATTATSQTSVSVNTTASNTNTSSSVTSQVSLSASVTGTADKKAGKWNVFAPAGMNNFTFSINLSTPMDGEVLKDITIKTNDATMGWSTSNSALYPLVIFAGGTQLNNSYSFTQALVNGSRTFYAYGAYDGQTMMPWKGGRIVVTFSDGTSTSADIPALSASNTQSKNVAAVGSLFGNILNFIKKVF